MLRLLSLSMDAMERNMSRTKSLSFYKELPFMYLSTRSYLSCLFLQGATFHVSSIVDRLAPKAVISICLLMSATLMVVISSFALKIDDHHLALYSN